MGSLDLIKANLGSVQRQRQIEAAVESGDTAAGSQLIHESILGILKAGLTPRQLRNYDELKQNNNDEITDLVTDAFDRGWWRNGSPNLSNALDEVLLTTQNRIREGRAKGECVESERAFFSEPILTARKRNALFWFVAFLIVSILVFRYATGWWTLFGYATAFMSFGAFLELLKKKKLTSTNL
jgi:hypothetical protein